MDQMKPSLRRVLNVLRAAGKAGMTPLELWREAGAYRASARIYELRKAGYVITARRLPHDASVCIYTLTAEPEQVAA